MPLNTHKWLCSHSAPRRYSVGFDLEQQLGKLLAQFTNEDTAQDSTTIVETCLEAAQIAFEHGLTDAAQDWMALLPKVIEVHVYVTQEIPGRCEV